MIRILDQYVSAKGIALFVAETALIVLSLAWGARLRYWFEPVEYDVFLGNPWFPWQLIARVAVFQVCFLYCDLYAPATLADRNEQIVALGRALGAGCLILGFAYFAFPELLVGRGVFVIGTALLAAGILVLRTAVNAAWKAAHASQNTIIIGTGALAKEVASRLTARDDLGARIVGFIGAGDRERAREQPLAASAVLADSAGIETVVRKYDVDRIIVAVEERRGALPIRQLLRLRFEGVGIEDAHDTLAALTGRVALETIQPSWFIFAKGFRRSRVAMAFKRCFDVSFAVAGLAVSLPLMALVAAAVWLDSGRPVLYRQRRVGLRGRVFGLLKFRSMRIDAEETGPVWAAADDKRVTRTGKYLRRFRLDELPQFVNIIQGEMSFVGPRPERPEFVEQLRQDIPYYDERHLVRPGLTGWAQVEYRYGSREQDAFRKLEYDLFYLKNMSMSFDLLIVAKTIRIVLTGFGAR